MANFTTSMAYILVLNVKIYSPYISQHFAAHVSSYHYNHKIIADKNRRLTTKYKKRNLCLVNKSERISMVPDTCSLQKNEREEGCQG